MSNIVEEKPKKVVKSPYRDLSLVGKDLKTIPEHCLRGNRVNPRLIIVTDKPTPLELDLGYGFASASAWFLEMTLDDAGLKTGNFLPLAESVSERDRRSVSKKEFVADLKAASDLGEVLYVHLNFYARIDDEHKIANSTPEEDFYCAAIFHELVLELRPKHILMLGNPAVKILTGRKTASDAAGATLSYKVPFILREAYQEGNCDPILVKYLDDTIPDIVVSTDLHPHHVQDSPRDLGIWRERLKKLGANLGTPIKKVKPKIRIFGCKEYPDDQPFAKAEEFLKEWIADPTLDELTYDWETTALNPCVHTDTITLTIGLARGPDAAFVIPTWHTDCTWTHKQKEDIARLIGKLLWKKRKVTLGQNLLFDNLVSRCEPYVGTDYKGIPIPGDRHETMYLAYVSDETGPQGLKELANLYTDLGCYDDELEKLKEEEKPKNYGGIPLHILAEYNGYDVIANFRLRNALIEKLKEDHRGPFINIALRLMSVQGQALEELAYNGQKIDRDVLFAEGRIHEGKLREAMLKLMSAKEMKDFIANRRNVAAVNYAETRITQPNNLMKDYFRYHPSISEKDRKPIRERIRRITADLKSNLAKVDEHGGLLTQDNDPHEEYALVFELFHAAMKEHFDLLDPAKDDLSKWKPWLKDDEYQADEEELRYYYEGTGYKPNFNTHGGGEMGDFFFRHLGLPVNFRSKITHDASLAKEARESLMGQHPLLNDFFIYKDTVKEYGSYFKPFIRGFRLQDANLYEEVEKLDLNGRAHLEIHIGRVVTGRTRGQLLQTLPRKGSVKKMFTSRFERGLIVQADMSQAELRTCACIANDRTMIQAYLNNEDLHKVTSNLLFGKRFSECTDPKIKKELRAASKRFNFGFLFGSGAPGLVSTGKKEGVEFLTIGELDPEKIYSDVEANLNRDRNDPYHYGEIEKEVDKIRVEIAQGLLKRFTSQYVDLGNWVASVHAFVLKHLYYFSPFGRIRRLPNAISADQEEVQSALRQAQNFPIQSSASDIAVIALAATQNEIRQLRFSGDSLGIAAVHDSLVFDSRFKRAVDTADILGRRLNTVKENFAELLPEFNTDWIKIPFQSDVEIGPSWGESYPYLGDGKLKVEDTENGAAENLIISVDDFWDWYDEKKNSAA